MHSNQTGSTKIISETRDKNEKSDLQQSFSGRSLSLSLSPFFQRREERIGIHSKEVSVEEPIDDGKVS